MYQPPNNEVLLQGRFFASRQGKRTLHQYVQEMRMLSASITVQPLPESVKVPAFVNGLRPGPARQALFRQMPAAMEHAISIAFVEEQSFNTGLANPWQRQWERPAPRGQGTTPMDLSSAEVVCYNCGKRGHIKARCTEPPRQDRAPNGGGRGRGGRGGRGGGGRGGQHAGRAGGSPRHQENSGAQ